MNRPTQNIHIIENGVTYSFDAVLKVEAQSTLKVADEAGDVNGKTHVNYAIKQPVKVQMEISVSDTVTVNNEPLTKGSGSRSVLAYRCLMDMQDRRNFLTIITPLYTFTKMLIEGMTSENSDDYNDGELHATIVFKEMTIQKKKEDNSKSVKPAESSNSVDVSVLAQGLGLGQETASNIIKVGVTSLTGTVGKMAKSLGILNGK